MRFSTTGGQSVHEGVRRVEAEDRSAALGQLLLGGHAPSPHQCEHLERFASDMGVDPGGLWGYYDARGKLTAVAWAAPQPGRTAMLFHSPVRRRRQLPMVTAAVDRACRELPPDRAVLVQALLDPEARWDLRALTDARFQELAVLRYLQKRIDRAVDRPALPADVALECWNEANRPDFIAAVAASYDQTMDCPALRGMRDLNDVIAGHMATGQFDPALWSLLRVEGRPAGVALLNRVPQQRCVELVYLGLAGEVRRRGLGGLLLSHGLWQCSQRNERRVVLAADESNAPALALYRQFGFVRTTRKRALIRPLPMPAM